MTEIETQSAVARSCDAQAAGYDRRWARYAGRSAALALAALPRGMSG